MRKIAGIAAGLAVALWASTAAASPIQLITNGNFEAGSLVGWTVSDAAGGSGSFFFDTPGTTAPLSSLTTSATAANGTGYAVADQTGPGTHALRQSFTLGASSSVILSFAMFVNDYDSGPIFGGQGLNYVGAANQFGRVDILTSGAGAFDTGAGVLANYFLGVDAGADPHGFTTYSFNITALVGGGGTFVLRFAEADNQGNFNMGVDNVSIVADAVPEPATFLLFATGLVGLVARRRFASRR